MQSMTEFDYTPDPVVAQLLDDFLKTEWKGFLKQKDLSCSPYTMTPDGLFILDHLPDHPQICIFAGGNGRAFKFSILLGRQVGNPAGPCITTHRGCHMLQYNSRL